MDESRRQPDDLVPISLISGRYLPNDANTCDFSERAARVKGFALLENSVSQRIERRYRKG